MPHGSSWVVLDFTQLISPECSVAFCNIQACDYTWHYYWHVIILAMYKMYDWSVISLYQSKNNEADADLNCFTLLLARHLAGVLCFKWPSMPSHLLVINYLHPYLCCHELMSLVKRCLIRNDYSDVQMIWMTSIIIEWYLLFVFKQFLRVD